MTNIILFDSDTRDHLLPLTYTRPCGEIRIGILTIKEKWERHLKGKASYITQDYLADKFPLHIEKDNVIINGSCLPSIYLLKLINELEMNEALLKDGELIAARLNEKQFERLMADEEIEELKGLEIGDTPFLKVSHPWDIFRLNAQALEEDFELITKGKTSQKISKTNQVLHPERIFLEEGARVECSILNASTGPIYIGKNAEIMEGSVVRGGLAMCEHAVLKLSAKIYGATTLGPHVKVGGEVNNCVFLGYANKAHDGFLGNAVIGEWCNLGADTNNSNLKNNYAEVKLWDYPKGGFLKTGLQFCGLIMGDHSKCGINTMFNTGTVIGVSCNIFGEGFPRNFIPSFSWGGKQGYQTYKTDKAFEVAEKVMARRNIKFSPIDSLLLLSVFEQSASYRSWDKTKKVEE